MEVEVYIVRRAQDHVCVQFVERRGRDGDFGNVHMVCNTQLIMFRSSHVYARDTHSMGVPVSPDVRLARAQVWAVGKTIVPRPGELEVLSITQVECSLESWY